MSKGIMDNGGVTFAKLKFKAFQREKGQQHKHASIMQRRTITS